MQGQTGRKNVDFLPVIFLNRNDTHGYVCRIFSSVRTKITEPNAVTEETYVLGGHTIMASKKMIRIRLKAYDHQLIDQAASQIV